MAIVKEFAMDFTNNCVDALRLSLPQPKILSQVITDNGDGTYSVVESYETKPNQDQYNIYLNYLAARKAELQKPAPDHSAEIAELDSATKAA